VSGFPVADVDPRTILIDRGADGFGFVLVCPRCGFDYQHANKPSRMRSWVGVGKKGGLLIPISGECGHEWGIVLDNYKGYEVLSVVSELDPAMHCNTEEEEEARERAERKKQLHSAGWPGLEGQLVKATVRHASGSDGAYDYEIEGYMAEMIRSGAETHLVIHSKRTDQWRMVRLSAVIELEVFKEAK
jgi:hypothetical protein